jgi:NADH/F420H2 dehydrogenase subunit C
MSEQTAIEEVQAQADSLIARFPEYVSLDDRKGYEGYIVEVEHLIEVVTALRDDFGYDYLSSVTGVDYLPDDFIEVVYHLYRSTGGSAIVIKTRASREETSVPSLVPIYPGADFQEREAWDLMGIRFEGHPDLRRILTDYGFSGHPFRKDFPLIGNVTVRYDEEKGRVVYEPVEIEPRVLVPRVIRVDSRYKADDIDKAADAAADSLASGTE